MFVILPPTNIPAVIGLSFVFPFKTVLKRTVYPASTQTVLIRTSCTCSSLIIFTSALMIDPILSCLTGRPTGFQISQGSSPTLPWLISQSTHCE